MSAWPGKYVIGLTGNIATGKSVVRKMLEHLGAYGIDADALGHRAIAKGAPGYEEVLALFGKWILTPDGQIDRAKLGKIVFTNPEALARLEAVVHPLVGQAVDFLVRRAKQKVIVIEAIKLLESELREVCDTIWVTYAPEEIQVNRLMNKRGMDEATARQRAAQSGFFESVHFVFAERSQLEKYGFTCTDGELELLNPIAATLDTLRPTLLTGLFNAASQNVKNGRKRVALFEIGSVFDRRRNESVKMAMLFSGLREDDAIDNAGKPAAIDFQAFTRLCADVIGDMELRPLEPSHGLVHPYQAAEVWQDGRKVGELFRLHPTVEEEMDLPRTVMCELDFDALRFGSVTAKPYSKYQASFRDLSVVVPETMTYDRIAEVVEEAGSAEVVRFYPVDRYQDEAMGDKVSLTLRFVLQSRTKTLEEDEISGAMEGVLEALRNEVGAELR